MKPVVREREILSTAHEVVKFSFDEESIQFLMDNFIDMYSDQEGAVIREYPSNAYDSHVEAGNTDPIEVFLPNALTPTFRVRDRGTGLSSDDLRDIYSKYGKSTKRHTNDQVGMLGLGCKAGLTYQESFSLTSVKDGIKTLVVVSRTSEGAAAINWLGEFKTDEPNGVEFSIDVKNIDEFCKKAREFFSYWEPGTVLVDEKEPGTIHDASLTFGEKFEVRKFSTNNEFYSQTYQGRRTYGSSRWGNLSRAAVVMGNVAYPLDNTHSGMFTRHLNTSNYGQFIQVIVRVPIGSFQPTPNREALLYTDEVKKYLSDLADEFNNELTDYLQEKLNAEENAWTAWRAASKLRNEYGMRETVIPSFNGINLPETLRTKEYITYAVQRWSSREASYGNDNFSMNSASNLSNGGLIIIKNFGRSRLARNHRDILNAYTAEKNLPTSQTYYIFRDGVHPILEDGAPNIIEWKDIEEKYTPSPEANKKVVYSKHDFRWVRGGKYGHGNIERLQENRAKANSDAHIVVHSPSILRSNRGRDRFLDLSKSYPERFFVLSARGDTKPFKDEVPFVTLENFLVEEKELIEETYGDNMPALYVTFKQTSRPWMMTKLDPESLDDDELAALLQAFNEPNIYKNLRLKSQRLNGMAREIGINPAFSDDFKEKLENAEDYGLAFEKRYPILFDSRQPAAEHLHLYANLIHAATGEENTDD